MAQQGFDGILFWPDYTLMFITSESERTTVRERLRVGRNLRERGVFRRRERGGLVERRLSAGGAKAEHRGSWPERGTPAERAFSGVEHNRADNVLEI
ncbi:hypothetical protein Bca52824_073116 [Brassica carinata]|uniref:Uncharacterized protein n=1 Tax=Brassica carinata TaxID=52824 RepID=A0A8X7QB09_BRACI|nr:hypothetical protein Bca52824_073116 [Brassica carinata]